MSRGLRYAAVVALCALVPTWLPRGSAFAAAAERDGYAVQWPLLLDHADAGAYRVPLSDAVYRTTVRPTLADLEVFDAEGRPQPMSLLPPDAPRPRPRLQSLPWFPLPAAAAMPASDITLISERDADGAIRRVEARVADAGAAAQPQAQAQAWLIDASRLREPVLALRIGWPPQRDALQATYRVEGSDDLRHWRLLQPSAPLLDLARDGQRLRQQRIALDGGARYLRLLPQPGSAPLPLASVHAELRSAAETEDWRWRTLRGRAVQERGITHYEYVLDGRFPVARADVAGAGNAAAEWTLHSRERDDAPWQWRAGPWLAFRLAQDGSAQSPPQALNVALRDRHWRLTPRTPVAEAPVLRLGYRAESVVFLAQGRPPFALAAGSTRESRSEAPLPQLLAALRARRGEGWQPASAALGAEQPLAGARALRPRRDWTAWLLWSLLAAGAVTVAGFAMALLRDRGAR